MRKILRINPKTHLVCVPQEMVEDGMVGDVDGYANAVTLTLVSPEASLEDIRTSLTTVLRDIEHRINLAARRGDRGELVKKKMPGNEHNDAKPLDSLRNKLKRGGR